MVKIYENQLLGHFLSPLGDRRLAIVELLGEEGAVGLREALAFVLLEQANVADNPWVAVAESDRPASPGFRSVVWRGGGYSSPAKLYAFDFKDAFKASALPGLGLALSLFGGPLTWALVPSGGEILRTLWSKFAAIREPEHADAIRLLDALSQEKANLRIGGSHLAPRWGDVMRRAAMDEASAREALKLLRDKSIIQIAEWGDQAEAVDHADNRWRVKF